MRFCTSGKWSFCKANLMSGFLADLKIRPVECPVFAFFSSQLSHSKIKPVGLGVYLNIIIYKCVKYRFF